MNQSTVNVTAPMTPDLELRARLAAARRRISRAELIRQAVVEYLNRLEAQAVAEQEVRDERR
ncbi:MAG: hypothetical protein Kow0031_29010 [Anaerolineae bacterium]